MVDATCVPKIDCEEMTKNGHPDAFWVIKAVESLQSKINIAHGWLQDKVIEESLGLSDIAADFSAPASFNSMALLAGIISSSFFVFGMWTLHVIAHAYGRAANNVSCRWCRWCRCRCRWLCWRERCSRGG